MTKQEIETKIKEVIAEVLEIDESDFTSKTSLIGEL